MPNNVTNRIEFHGNKENIKKVLELIKGENEEIDFNKIIPTPDYIYQGNLGQQERELYGKNNWYDWNCKYWGTKWNAYWSHLEDDNIIIFDTAWSSPIPIFNALAHLCGEHQVWFTGEWADEDRGSNTGTFKSGCEGDEYWFDYDYTENFSNEAYEIYVKLKGEDMCMDKDENGNWIAYTCEDCPNRENC